MFCVVIVSWYKDEANEDEVWGRTPEIPDYECCASNETRESCRFVLKDTHVEITLLDGDEVEAIVLVSIDSAKGVLIGTGDDRKMYLAFLSTQKARDWILCQRLPAK